MSCVRAILQLRSPIVTPIAIVRKSKASGISLETSASFVWQGLDATLRDSRPRRSSPAIGDALENIVSAFDGFGRELSMRKGTEIRFQNLHGARRNVQEKFGFDFAYVLTALQWQDVCRVFQKRHLLAHKMGVIDDDYVQKASDPEAVAGRKVHVNSAEVNSSIEIIELLGRSLFAGILPPAP